MSKADDSSEFGFAGRARSVAGFAASATWLRGRIGGQLPKLGPPVVVLIAAFACSLLVVEAQGSGEYAVKAAFMYNFAKFVEWPGDAGGDGGSPLIIGVVGDDPFGANMDQMVAGKTANGRQVAIRRFKWGQDLRQCHILFISSSERKHLAQILGSLKGSSVLTVADMDQFDQEGGMIKFVLDQNKVRFEINIDAAERARLKLSSKLLALAKSVRGQH